MSRQPLLVKMSGAGNDFVLLDGEQFRQVEPRFVEWVRRICRRGLSVGADGVLVVDGAGDGRVRVRFFNPDGGEAFCGNGTRCSARFAAWRGMAPARMVLETLIGDVPARVIGERVELRLPPPVDRGDHAVEVEGELHRGRLVHAGVPHFILSTAAIESAPLERWGPALRRHPSFGADGVNVDLAMLRDDGGWALRTWERGVEGETLACGSGAVAAAHAARLRGAGETVRVVPASGVPLEVELPGPPGEPREAILRGDARFVFEGIASDEATRGF